MSSSGNRERNDRTLYDSRAGGYCVFNHWRDLAKHSEQPHSSTFHEACQHVREILRKYPIYTQTRPRLTVSWEMRNKDCLNKSICVTIRTSLMIVIYEGSFHYPGNWNKFFLKDLYIPIVGVANNGVLDDMILLFILSCLVSNVCFNCIVRDSLYHNMDIEVPCAIVHWWAAPHHSL